MPEKSSNIKIAQMQELEDRRSLETFHEARARKKEEQRMEAFGGQRYILEWFENNKSRQEGRIGRIFSKYKTSGTLKKEALVSVYEQFKEGNKWDKDDYKKVIQHISEGSFANFGEKIPLILELMDDKDDEIRDRALAFIRQKTLQGEKTFLEKIKEIKLQNLRPEDLTNQTSAMVRLLDKGPDTTVKAETKEVVKTTDLGILPPPPEQEKYAEKVRALTSYLEESTKRLNKLEDIVEKSSQLATSKDALQQKIESDPAYVEKVIEQLVGDYDLLKRTAEVIAKASKNEALQKALQSFNAQRRAHQYEEGPVTLKEDETLHARFLKAKEGVQAKEALLKAAKQEIPNGLIKTALEIEVKRAVDEEVFDAADNDRDFEDGAVTRNVQKIQDKYELDAQLLEPEMVESIKAASLQAVDYERKNKATRKEYLDQAIKINQWQALCIEMANHIDNIQQKAGIKLVETQDGLNVYPRQITVTYKDAQRKSLAQRAEQDELDPETDQTAEFVKNENGQVKFTRRKAKITNIQYIPQKIDDDEPEAKADYEATQSWRKGKRYKGALKITVEREDEAGKKRTDVMSQRDFLAWVATDDVIEEITDPKQVEQMYEEQTGMSMKVQGGAVFMAESTSGDPHTYDLVEIKSVDKGIVTFNISDQSPPPIYRSRREVPESSSIQIDQTARHLPLGAFYSMLTRRDMVPIGDDVDLSNLSTEDTPFWYSKGPKTDGELRWLKMDGTMADLLETHGDKLFAGGVGALTAGQLDAFKKTPIFQERFLDPAKRHIVRENIPGKRLMQDQRKNLLQNPLTGEPAIPGGEMPEDEAIENPNISDKQKEILNKENEEKKKAVKDAKQGHRHYRQEALNFNETGSAGEAQVTQIGYLSGLWRRTTFLAADDFWGLGKACYEHYQRRWQRRSKDKFAKVGKGLPWGYGTEMNRIGQQAENEEVNQNMEAMEDWGVWQIQDTLRNAGNKDQLKACFQILAKKGHLRWDDIEMWRKINEYIPQSLVIPIPSNDNPNFLDKKTNRTGFDYLEGALDYLWGEGTYQGWMSENDSTYNSEFKKYWEKGKRLEGDPKNTDSVVGEMQILLTKHKNGEWVDPHEYEGLIHFMIDAGKGNMEAKLYYMVEGVCIKSPSTGKTLMSLDRIGSINGDYLNKLPWMDYMVRRDVPRPDGTSSPWSLADMQRWCAGWDSKSPLGQENKPNQSVIDFIWTNVLTDERTIIRNNKGLRNAQDMDHDDAHFIIPLADEELTTNICQNAGGQRKYFTTEGYANAYPGYNQYLKTLTSLGQKAKVINCVRSFARFNSIMDRRYAKESDALARLGPSFWNRPSVVDSRYTGFHKAQLEKLLFEIAEAYRGDPGGERLVQLTETMHIHTEAGEKERQKEVENAILNYGKQLEKVVKSDGGDKMMSTISGFNLTGMSDYVSEEEKAMRSKMYAEEDDLSKTFTDFGNEAN